VAENLVDVDRETPMLLPADLRQWVPEDDLAHCVINVAETMKLPGQQAISTPGEEQVDVQGTCSLEKDAEGAPMRGRASCRARCTRILMPSAIRTTPNAIA